MKAWSDIISKGRPFIKMQGLKNHFVIVDGRECPFKPSVEEIINICDPEVGVGAEQLLVIEPVTKSGEGAYARVRIYNPDGPEVEACGNATRCVAKLLSDETGLEELGLENCLYGRVGSQCAAEEFGSSGHPPTAAVQ